MNDLRNTSEVFGGGLNFIIDKRDNQFSPSKGSYFELNSTMNFNSTNMNLSYTQIILDTRKYFELNKNIWAFQFYNSNQIGEVPIFEKNRLGGQGPVERNFSRSISRFTKVVQCGQFQRIG